MSTISAGTASGTALVQSGDTTGQLVLQTNGSTTAVTIATNQVVTLAQPLPVGSGGTGATSLSGITTGTATNLAGGSNGTIPYQSAAGTTQMLAVGSAGQVLQTNGAGAPSWVTPGGGSWIFLSAVTASNSATVDIETTFDSTYQNYAIVASSVRPVDSVVALRARQKQGGSYKVDNYQYHLSRSNNSANTYAGSANGNATSYLVANDLSDAAGGPEGGASFVMYIPNPSNTTLRKTVFSMGVVNSAFDGAAQMTLAGANFDLTSALTGIRFFFDSGNISSGTFRLYGIKNS